MNPFDADWNEPAVEEAAVHFECIFDSTTSHALCHGDGQRTIHRESVTCPECLAWLRK